MKQKLVMVKKGVSKYWKALINTIISTLVTAVPFAWYPALYRIKSLEAGEYPGESAEVISARLLEMRPGIIREALVRFLLLAVLFFMIYFIYWVKRYYNISLIQKMRTEMIKKK